MDYKVTVHPWRYQQDLHDVCDKFFAYRREAQHITTDEDVQASRRRELDEEQRLAINIVATWEYRGHVPHPIVATAALADALLTYRQFNDSHVPFADHAHINEQEQRSHGTTAPKLPPFAARAMFATAIARFVTGYCDVGHGGTVKRSMYDVAAEIGMPEEFVAMRHEITHGILPHVPEMRKVAQDALEWLWLMYWNKLDAEVPVQALSPSLKQQLQSALKNLLKLRKDFLKSRGKLFPVEVYSDIVKLVQKHAGGAASIAEILVAERLLLPSSKAAEFNMKAAFLIWDQPLDYLMSALPLLHAQLISSLLTRLQTHTSNTKDVEAVIAWLKHLVSDAYSVVQEAIRKEAIDEVMESCLLHPSTIMSQLAQAMMTAANAEVRSAWVDLCGVSNAAISSTAVEPSMDLDVEAFPGQDQAPITIKVQEGGWNPFQGIWTPRPIGVLHQHDGI